jgi:sortase A
VKVPSGGASKNLLLAEKLAWAVGIALLAVWGIARLAGHVGARRELGRFEAARASARLPEDRPDLTLWSPGRVRAWEESLKREGPAPLAVLKISKIDLTVPVLEGTDDWTLNRAVGHIEETARPGEKGNCGIAGHRDGFFRGLKDVAIGDAMELTTLTGSESYRIETIRVVGPDEVSVLEPTPEPSITLVTCYPFYFVGSAPQRYIVQAAKSPSSRAAR